MSYSSFGLALPLRRRVNWGLDDSALPQIGPPRVGPDIPAQPPPMMPMQPPPMQSGDSGLGQAIGTLAGAGLNKLVQLRSAGSNLKPDGSSPFDSLPSANPGKLVPDGSSPFDRLSPPTSGPLAPGGGGGGLLGGVKKFFGFAGGGNLSQALRRVGDVATVGEDGPELAVKTSQGTEIVPLAQLPFPSLGDRFRAAVLQSDGSPSGQSSPSYLSDAIDRKYSDSPSLTTVTRPRVVGSDPYARLRALTTVDPNAPATDTPSGYQPAQPQPQGTIPLAQVTPPSPYFGRLKNIPLTGEEDANDLQYTDRLSQYTTDAPTTPGLGPSLATVTRPRFADPAGRLESQITYERQNPATAPQGRSFGRKIVDALEMAGVGARRGAAANPQNPLAGAVGGAGGGAIAEVVNPNVVYRAKQDARVGRYEGELQNLRGEQESAAKVRTANAQAGWLEARPQIAEQRNQVAALKQEQSRIFRVLGSMKGQYLDPNNPRIAKLLSDADAAGIPIDVDSFNNSKGNTVRYAKVDPDHPEQTQTVERNVVTGEESVLGQKGYTQPVGPDGMTAAQRQAAKDRETAQANLEKQRSIQNEFQRQRINLSTGRFSLAQAAQNNRLSEQTRKEAKDVNDLAAEAERFQQASESVNQHGKYIDPNTGEEKESSRRDIDCDKLAAQAAALRQKLFANYGYLFDQDGTGPKMTTDKFKGLFPSLQGNWSGEAQRLGVTLTDNPTQGPVRQSPMPRRGAPRAAQPATQSGGAHVSRAAARAKYPQLRNASDDEVDAAIRSAGYEPIP
jgi:hypothetical protein